MMKSVRRTQSVAIILTCAAVGSVALLRPQTCAAADLPGNAAFPTSQPAPEMGPERSFQEIAAEFQLAEQATRNRSAA